MGEFNTTSKLLSSSYGCKGEALAAFSKISKVKVISKVKSSIQAYAKNLYDDRIVYLVPQKNEGTTILVQEIFYNIPVRRKATKSATEISRIKELVGRLSVVNYSVSFVVYDYASRKTVLNIPQDRSLKLRLIRLHSEEIFSKMTVKSY